MCGLAGWLAQPSSEQAGSDKLQAMLQTITARGPDGAGFYIRSPVALGHRRLSILDLSKAGTQPMCIVENGPTIVYNGEIYNFSVLRGELERAGAIFRSDTDTEVILRTYMHWGLEGLRRLEGMFAFAIWDPRSERLILMRDRLGIKPLYYGEASMGLAFGSQISTVLAAGGCDTTLDEQAFSEYLWFGNTYEDRTFYKGIRQLLPGHWMIIEGGKCRNEPWWKIEEWCGRQDLPSSFDTAVELMRDALDTAVARQLVSDVPLGLFLSGGLDSSSIAASAIRAQSHSLVSYAAGFDFDKGVNELPKAAKVARHLNLQHSEIHIAGKDVKKIVLDLVQAHGEPFADAANIPLYLMAKQVSSNTQVILQGDGGDELFAGYRRYQLLQNAHWWKQVPSSLVGMSRKLGRKGRRLARIIDIMNTSDPAKRMALLLTVETKDSPPERFFRRDYREHLKRSTDPFLVYNKSGERFADYEPVQQMLLTDLTVQLPSQFLTKVDRSTMAASLEVRVPLLDEKIASLAVGMPTNWKVNGKKKKVLLHATQNGRLPVSILNLPKTGFGVPYSHWLRDSLYDFVREATLDNAFVTCFNLDKTKLELAIQQHHDGTRDHGFIIWKMLQLALWSEISVK